MFQARTHLDAIVDVLEECEVVLQQMGVGSTQQGPETEKDREKSKREMQRLRKYEAGGRMTSHRHVWMRCDHACHVSGGQIVTSINTRQNKNCKWRKREEGMNARGWMEGECMCVPCNAMQRPISGCCRND